VQAQVRDIITAAPKDGQIGALYNSFMDEARLEQVGIKPLQADLAQVRALPDKSAFARFMGLTRPVSASRWSAPMSGRTPPMPISTCSISTSRDWACPIATIT
jgi:hypothetical protein